MAQRLTEKELRDMSVGVWDIESTGLNAGFGWLLCCSFVPLFKATKKNVVTFRITDDEDYAEHIWDDDKLIANIVDHAEQYDVLVGHNSVWFDAMMVNTRAALQHKWLNTEIKHLDTYQFARKQLRTPGRSLDSVLTHFETKAQKTKLKPKEWRQAACGHQESLEYIVRHNVADVLSLAELTRKLLKATHLPYRYVR